MRQNPAKGLTVFFFSSGNADLPLNRFRAEADSLGGFPIAKVTSLCVWLVNHDGPVDRPDARAGGGGADGLYETVQSEAPAGASETPRPSNNGVLFHNMVAPGVPRVRHQKRAAGEKRPAAQGKTRWGSGSLRFERDCGDAPSVQLGHVNSSGLLIKRHGGRTVQAVGNDGRSAARGGETQQQAWPSEERTN